MRIFMIAEADYSEQGQLEFYKGMNNKRGEVRKMNVPRDIKNRLYGQIEEVVEAYEEIASRHFRHESVLAKLAGTKP